MSLRIGVPRGLLYYYYGKLWESFFNELGAEVIVSGETSVATLQCGSMLDEVCLPVKAYFGHVSHIYKKVDYLFMPRIISVSPRQYTCPQVIGLTDMVRSNITNLPPLIDINVSLFSSRRHLYESIIAVGEQLGKGALASLYAWHKSYSQLAVGGKEISSNVKSYVRQSKRIGLIGHPYIIYDNLISMNVLDKLHDLEVDIVTADRIGNNCANRAAGFLEKKLFWSHCQHLVGAAQELLTMPMAVDGIIVMTAFACGPDSLMGDIIKRQAQAAGIPCMLLTVDEHTAESAFVTRLEAFVDMLKRRCS